MVSERLKAWLSLTIFLASGSGLFVVHVIHALGDEENMQTFLLGIAFPLFLSLGLLAGSAWLWRSDLNGSHLLRIGLWWLGGGSAFAVWAGLLFFYQLAEGVALSHPGYFVANAITGGCVIGLIIGVYDSRQRTSYVRAERSSHHLTVLNRILRHDVRNRANVIHGRTELVVPENGSDDHLEAIRQQAMELVELGDNAQSIEMLLHGDDEHERLNISAVLEKQLDRLERDHSNIAIQASVPAEEYVSALPLIESALANILENAIVHNDKQSPRVTVDCSRSSEANSEYINIRIADNGPGIPDGELDVLERGYETPLDHMTGLGLWLINWIITASGGEVRFEENSPEGSVVCVRLEAAHVATSNPEPIPN